MKKQKHGSSQGLGQKWPQALALAIAAAGTTALPSALAADSSCNGDTTGAAQNSQYCQASQSADEAADKNKVLGSVHAGAAALCLPTCSPAGAGLIGACTAGVYGGVATDIVVGKDFSGAISRLADKKLFDAAFDKYFLSADEKLALQNTQPTQQTPQQTQTQARKSACASGVKEGVVSVRDFSNASEADSVAAANKKLASNVKTGGLDPLYNPSAADDPNSGAATANGSSGSASVTVGSTSGGSPCRIGATTGDYAAVTQCVAASGDKEALRMLQNPNFAQGIQKVTGMSAPEFFAKAAKEGTGAIGSGISGAMGSEYASSAMSMVKAFSGLNSERAQNVGYVSSGGGAKRSPASKNLPDFNSTLADLMAKLQQKPEDAKKDETNLAFAFKGERYPANVTENRNVSLFERVTFRYFTVSPRVLGAAQK